MSRGTDHGSKRVPIVGIGASAGGVEALQGFFSALAHDLGLAYVVIVHLSPDHKSDLAAILARKTHMPVHEVKDGNTIGLVANQVYVISPDSKLEITDTSVVASPFVEPRGQRAAIDIFFRSLAATHGDGFAVVLSGGGSDGAVGAKAVKEAGGLVLVQDPHEAIHEGMPRAAISTGLADVVLPVRELAARLAELSRHKETLSRIMPPAGADLTVDQAQETWLRHILEILRTRTGHDFSKYKRNTILRRLARRMQLSHRSSVDEYHAYLKDHPEEIRALFDDLLITVTTFFRDSDAWAALRKAAIVPLVEHSDPAMPIRAWVPGCATGEEAYTLAILFSEEIEWQRKPCKLTIFASDVDQRALATAREGRYPSAIRADVSEQRLRRYFKQEGHHYRVSSGVRDCVVFAAHSLLGDPPFSRLDVVSCRNLLIYLDHELQDQANRLFRYALRDGGYLFLGSAEAANGDLFRALDKQHRVFQAREHAAVGGIQGPPPELLARAHPVQAGLPPRPQRQALSESHLEALEEHAPPSVLVDERYTVLHVSPTADRFLERRGGEPATSIADLVRPALAQELRKALQHAFEAGEACMSPFVAVPFGSGAPRRVAVLVQPQGTNPRKARALVFFLAAGRAAAEEVVEESEPVLVLHERLREAEQRIDQARNEHHATDEDLRAANEELQSLNEEYRSTTEELETSKEELQSINEELQTVNHELKVKLEEASRANNDLENLMAATDIATLFLDRNLAISRFTPPLSEIFNVQPSDRGRPIADFTRSLDYETLEDDAREVLAELVPIEREVKGRDGRQFIVRLRPYRTADDRIEGVVITLIDVSLLKQAEDALRESERKLEAELAVSHRHAAALQAQDQGKEEFLSMLGHELRNPLAAIENSVALVDRGVSAGKDKDTLDELMRRTMAIVARQSRHMSRLVNDLLDITRINQGKLHLHRETTDINECIRNLAQDLATEMRARQLELECDLIDEPLYVEADPDRLTQILENLLRNAMVYTNPGGSVCVTSRREDGRAKMSVRDTGIGIDPHEIESLFEPYRQGSHAERGGGVGLGLTLCKRLVLLHGGEITATSEGRGLGSEFTVVLPLSETPRKSERAPTHAALPSRRQIIVVDDEADVADTFALLLGSLGQDVEVAYDGLAALETVQRQRPEVAFIDLSMRGMGGHELARRLRERFGAGPPTLVALTGHARGDDHKNNDDQVFDHYMLKPISVGRVVQLLESLAS